MASLMVSSASRFSRHSSRPSASKILTLVATVSAVTGVHAQSTATETAAYVEDSQEYFAMGFGAISYLSKDGDNTDGFAIGQVVAHLGASMGDSLSIFGEFTLTAKESVHSTGMALDLVMAIPGSISFSPADMVTDEVKIVRIDGLLPGDAGYPLK